MTALSRDEPHRRDDEPAWTDWFGGPAREAVRELAPPDTGDGALGVPNSVTPIEIFDGDRRSAPRPGTKTTAEARSIRVPRRA